MEDRMNYIVISQKHTIAYNEEKCLINQKEYLEKDRDGKTSKAFAEEKQNEFYLSLFQRHFPNIVVLTAAGTSMDNDNGSDTSHRGKTRKGLWNACKKEIEAFNTEIEDIDKKPFFNLKGSDGKELGYGDIEELLSFLVLYSKANEVDDSFNKKLATLKNSIVSACRLTLQSDAPHQVFLNKLSARKPSDSRVQLFTTNYDTLFEQAANNAGFTIVDGFSYTQPRVFSGRFFDYDFVNRERSRLKNEESFIPKVFHLYKLHGSLVWEREDNGRIIQKENPLDPLIIYPASDKYESSYEQPYFEMMSRFQQALRKDNVLLIIVGFGFKDKHILSAILEAVEQNPSFQLVIVDYNNEGTINRENLSAFFEGKDKGRIKRNVSIIFDKFRSFVEKYPENETYNEESLQFSDESIR